MRKKRKKGFTLLELVAVITIVLVLIAVMMPKIQGYFLEARKIQVIDEARKIRMAVVTYEESTSEEFRNLVVPGFISNTVGAAKNFYGTSKLLDGEIIDKLNDGVTLDIIYQIVENRADFKVNSNGEFLGLI